MAMSSAMTMSLMCPGKFPHRTTDHSTRRRSRDLNLRCQTIGLIPGTFSLLIGSKCHVMVVEELLMMIAITLVS